VVRFGDHKPAGLSFSADSSTYANTNASNYGVKIIASTGTFSGYAWGEDIGWINFNGSCDSGTADACAGGTYEVTTTFFSIVRWRDLYFW